MPQAKYFQISTRKGLIWDSLIPKFPKINPGSACLWFLVHYDEICNIDTPGTDIVKIIGGSGSVKIPMKFHYSPFLKFLDKYFDILSKFLKLLRGQNWNFYHIGGSPDPPWPLLTPRCPPLWYTPHISLNITFSMFTIKNTVKNWT